MSKHKHTQPHPKQQMPAPRSKRGIHRRALVVGGIAGALGGWYLLMRPESEARGRSFSVLGGETKPVLDPLRFRERNIREAYLAASRYPEVMDSLHCYCNCDRPPFNHRSLLSCFTDYHGAG